MRAFRSKTSIILYSIRLTNESWSQAVKRLGVPDERVVRTLRETGNISSACIPLALDRLANAGALHTGDTIALVGFGAGLDIGGYLLRWK